MDDERDMLIPLLLNLGAALITVTIPTMIFYWRLDRKTAELASFAVAVDVVILGVLIAWGPQILGKAPRLYGRCLIAIAVPFYLFLAWPLTL